MPAKDPYVYLLCNHYKGTFYTGVTSNLVQRIWQHRNGLVDGFTADYGVKRLVWFEHHPTMESAIAKEKRVKKLSRSVKCWLIEKMNPNWDDLYETVLTAFGSEKMDGN